MLRREGRGVCFNLILVGLGREEDISGFRIGGCLWTGVGEREGESYFLGTLV